MCAQIHQNGSVGLATPQRKIIDAKDAWCLKGAGTCSFDVSQECVSADRYSHVLDQMRSCLSAEQTGNAIQKHPQTGCSSCLKWNHSWYPLRTCVSGTLLIRTAKSANTQDQPNLLTADRQVGRGTSVITMNTMGIPAFRRDKSP